MMINLYTMDNCRKCDALRTSLKLLKIPYSVTKFKNLDELFEEFKYEQYIINAPVLSVDDVIYDNGCLFDGDLVRPDIATLFVKGD